MLDPGVDDSATQGNVMRDRALGILLVGLVVAWVGTVDATTQTRDYFLTTPSTQKYAVIFGGIGAGKTYAERFRQWAFKLHDLLTGAYGYRPEHVTLLLDRGGTEASRISGPCRRETILTTMAALKTKVQPGDQVTFVFIGHGTSDEKTAKFVIAGPDITGDEFADQLASFVEQDIVVVHTTSSGYPFCTALSAPGRVILCATRSRAETYDTVFAPFFLEALDQHAADRDKNGRLSMFEAFGFVREKVKTWYADQDRLSSEHPTLDDNGDGRFHTHPDPVKDEGRWAQVAYLDTLTASLPEAVAGQASESLRTLTAKAQALERSVVLLRNQKAELTADDYQQQMETLLIELARTMQHLKRVRPDGQEVQFE